MTTNNDALREALIEHIKAAIVEHCCGSDLYMSALRAAEKIEAIAQQPAPEAAKHETSEYDRGWKDGYKHGAWSAKPEQQAQGEPWKDHDTAKLVNELRDVAIQFHAAQQLRERIAYIIKPLADQLQSHREAIAKKDAALQACVEALIIAIAQNGHDMLMTGEEQRIAISAITQAQEALK